MNLLVHRGEGDYCVRPDTTLEREATDFYVPDDCLEVEVRKCIWSRIIKAGKAVGPKFVERYIESFAEGYLLYCNGSPWVDGSSILMRNVRPLDEKASASLAEALVGISKRTSIRIGDILIVEEPQGVTLRKGDSFECISLR